MASYVSDTALEKVVNLTAEMAENQEKSKTSWSRQMAVKKVFANRVPEDYEHYKELEKEWNEYEALIKEAQKDFELERKDAANVLTRCKNEIAQTLAEEAPLKFTQEEIDSAISMKKDNNGSAFIFSHVGQIKVENVMEHYVEMTRDQEKEVIQEFFDSGDEKYIDLLKLDEQAYLEYDQESFQNQKDTIERLHLDRQPQRMKGVKTSIMSKLLSFRASK